MMIRLYSQMEYTGVRIDRLNCTVLIESIAIRGKIKS